jgi:2-C-methyl-D-erythritol 4-phosphate cytidylyltransferase
MDVRPFSYGALIGMSGRLRVVIPAAGVGRRMGGELPKQYRSLCGRTILECTIEPFLLRTDITEVCVVHAHDDERIGNLRLHDSRLKLTLGGDERASSVLAGLNALTADDNDWVLVHDAARPCLHRDDLSRLIDELQNDQVGGLLATPVTDTLKRSDDGHSVIATVSREGLWRALTPQMFRFGVLKRALVSAREQNVRVTDEASAVEALGLRPKLVIGRADNIKITVPEDLTLAEFILQSRR